MELKRDLDKKNDLIVKNQQMLAEAMSKDKSRNLSSGHNQHQQKHSHRFGQYHQQLHNRRKIIHRSRGGGRDFDDRA